MLANQEILQFSNPNSIIISNEKGRIVQLHEYVVTLQTSGQNHTATIDLNQFLPVVDGHPSTPIVDLGMTIVNDVEQDDDNKIIEIMTDENEIVEFNDGSEQRPQIKVEILENEMIRKSKRTTLPRITKKIKHKIKKSGVPKKIKNSTAESDIIQSKDEIADDNNDVYDSDGTVELNENEDDKCSEPSECDLFMNHEKFAGFPKVIIQNSKLIFRGKKLLDLMSR